MNDLNEDPFSVWRQELLREFSRKNVVIFLGSGLSCRARSQGGKNAPTWPGLLNELKRSALRLGLIPNTERVHEPDRMIDSRSTDDYLIAAAYLKSKFDVGNESIKSSISEILGRFDPDFQGEDAHSIISRLPVAGYVSTNYDSYLEDTYAKTNRKSLKVLSANSKGVLSVVSHNAASPWLIKLHGQIGFSEDFVISFDDYEEAYATGRIETLLTAILTRYTVLFVGFGFREPPIMNVLRAVFQRLGRDFNRHYAFSDSTTLDSIKSRLLLDNFNIQTIHYPKHSQPRSGKKIDLHENFQVWLKDPERHLRSARPPSVRLLIDLRIEDDESTSNLYVKKSKRTDGEVYLWPSIEWPHLPPGNELSVYASHNLLNAMRDQFRIDGGDFSNLMVDKVGRIFIGENKENIAYGGLTYDFYFQFISVRVKKPHAQNFINKLRLAMPGLRTIFVQEMREHLPTAKYNAKVISEFADL